MIKIAKIPWNTIKQVAGPAAAMAGGYAFGHQVMPHVAGYEDVENARRIGGMLSAFEALTIMLAIKRYGLKGLKELAYRRPGAAAAAGASIAGAETIPAVMAAMHRVSKAPVSIAESMEHASKKPSAVEAFNTAMTSPTARGIGVGAGTAGLAGLVSGLTRRKTREEELESKARPGMIASDTIKFMIPAMVAGGVIGSLKKPN